VLLIDSLIYSGGLFLFSSSANPSQAHDKISIPGFEKNLTTSCAIPIEGFEEQAAEPSLLASFCE
jgi:hypothetical protein